MSSNLINVNALNKAFLGWDSIINDFEHRFANQLQSNYPPHNIVRTSENDRQIQIAVTGFEPDEITVQVDQDVLVIKGEAKEEDSSIVYEYRGLAGRDFVRAFKLPEYSEVGEAKIKNGVLTIDVTRRIPEALKPRTLKIKCE
jgi:molecular chaperone IbpA